MDYNVINRRVRDASHDHVSIELLTMGLTRARNEYKYSIHAIPSHRRKSGIFDGFMIPNSLKYSCDKLSKHIDATIQDVPHAPATSFSLLDVMFVMNAFVYHDEDFTAFQKKNGGRELYRFDTDRSYVLQRVLRAMKSRGYMYNFFDENVTAGRVRAYIYCYRFFRALLDATSHHEHIYPEIMEYIVESAKEHYPLDFSVENYLARMAREKKAGSTVENNMGI